METQKLKQSQSLAKEYQKKVATPYDERNKGSYFHYEWETNKDNNGVTWENGGEELIETGRDLISRSMRLYLPEFLTLYHQVSKIRESMDFIKAPLDGVLSNLGCLTSSLQSIEEGNHTFDKHSSFGLYKHMKGFGSYGGVEGIPTKYIWSLGEMVFHQIRVEEISHACEGYAHRTCRSLDEVLRNLHFSQFEDKKLELGRALVKEILSAHYNLNELQIGQPLPAMEAQKVIRDYRLSDEDITSAVDESLVLQAQKYAEIASLRRKVKTVEHAHSQELEKILSRVGLKPCNS